MKIDKLVVAGFRGFNEKREFVFGSGLNIIYGPNGLGKTSVAEAVEWLFFGETSKLRLAASKREFQNSLRNLHYLDANLPFVEVSVVFSPEVRHTIRRELLKDDKSNLFVDGVVAQDLKKFGIHGDTTPLPVVAQHALKEFIQSAPADRWQTFSKMLGLEILSGFRISLTTAITQFRNRNQIAINRVDDIVSNIRSKNSLQLLNGILSAMQGRDMGTFRAELEKVTEQILGFRSSVPQTALRDKLKELVAELAIVPAGFLQAATSEESMKSSYIMACELVSSIERFLTGYPRYLLLNTVNPMMERLKFLKHGLGLTHEDDSVCPFCGESTLTSEKRAELGIEVKSHKDAISLFTELQNELTSVTQNVPILLRGLKEWIPQNIGDEDWLEGLGFLPDFLLTELLGLVSTIQKLNSGFATLDDTLTNALKKVTSDFQHRRLDHENLSELTGILKEAVSIIVEMEQVGKSLEQLQDRCLPYIQKHTIENERVELITQVSGLWGNKLVMKEACDVQSLLERMQILKEQAEQHEKSQSDIRLKAKATDVLEWYNLLNPNEGIRLSKIGINDSRSRQVDLLADLYGKTANAAAMLSEAHINATGLSVYLAQIASLHSPFKFAILDDPVQSMDDDHRLRLQTDLVERLLSQGYQIVILSHLKTFTDELREYHDVEFHYEFFGYGQDGPQVRDNGPVLNNYLQVAYDLRHGSAAHRTAAVNSLRKAAERLCKMIHQKQSSSPVAVRFQSMSSKDLKAIVKSSILPDDTRKVNMILRYADPSSHDDLTFEPPTEGMIDSMVETMVTLAKFYVDPNFSRPRA